MAITGENNVYAGGLSFSSSANMGTGAGGFNFDLPLATVAQFNADAIAATKANSDANRGFLSSQLARSEVGVNNATTSAFEFVRGSTDRVAAQSESAIQGARAIASEAQSQSLWRQIFAPKAAKAGKSCFITTAVCESEGLADDCETLQTLRKFRDEYMLTDDARALMVAQYYEMAPGIVEALDMLPDGGAHAYTVLRGDIDAAIARIRSGDFDGAMRQYSYMTARAYKLAHDSEQIRSANHEHS